MLAPQRGLFRNRLKGIILSKGSSARSAHDHGQHAAYVGFWIKTLRDDPLEIFRAVADAEKIQAFVLGLEQEQVQIQVVTAIHLITRIIAHNIELIEIKQQQSYEEKNGQQQVQRKTMKI